MSIADEVAFKTTDPGARYLGGICDALKAQINSLSVVLGGTTTQIQNLQLAVQTIETRLTNVEQILESCCGGSAKVEKKLLTLIPELRQKTQQLLEDSKTIAAKR